MYVLVLGQAGRLAPVTGPVSFRYCDRDSFSARNVGPLAQQTDQRSLGAFAANAFVVVAAASPNRSSRRARECAETSVRRCRLVAERDGHRRNAPPSAGSLFPTANTPTADPPARLERSSSVGLLVIADRSDRGSEWSETVGVLTIRNQSSATACGAISRSLEESTVEQVTEIRDLSAASDGAARKGGPEAGAMSGVVALRDARQARAAEHPLFKWMRSENVPVERRLDFAPMMALFVMQFRDANMWVLRFSEARNEFEWVINSGTIEDQTHSRMFLVDWRALGLDARLGWRASDTLWWLFLSEENEVMRRCGMRFISFSVADGGDPLVRFGHSEAGEATGHVFLSASARIAREISERTGAELPYFGPHHLALESGHVANTEGVFEKQLLTSEQLSSAKRLCGEMFDAFDEIFTAFEAYARRYVDTGTTPVRTREAAPHVVAIPKPIEAPIARGGDDRSDQVWTVLRERQEKAASHQLYEWLHDGGGLSAYERLCRFIPLWTMDILGYRDLAKHVFTYPEPRDEAERAINRWAAELASHSALFLNDWDNLGLDELLGFSASDTLEFVFLDPDMDLHREHLVDFAMLGMRHRDPVVRWWMMTALESTGETFFSQTRPLAQAVERERGVRLDYLAERHLLTGDAGDARPPLPPGPLTADQEATVIGLIHTIYDALESQLTRSYAVARADRFGVS